MNERATESPARVRLERVDASDTLGAKGGALGRLRGLDWSIGVGLHAVVGTPADGAAALVQVLAGAVEPRVGRIFVDGAAPFASARARARIGALLPKPALFGATVADCAKLVARTRGDGQDPLASVGAQALGRRTIDSLSFAEARAVEFALALATPDPSLLVLYEPWVSLAGIDGALLDAKLRELALRVPVVLVVSGLSDIAGLAADVALLDGGKWAAVDGGSGWTARAGSVLVVRLVAADSSAPGALAARLGDRLADARSIGWSASEGEPRAYTVSVESSDLERAAYEVVRACDELDLDVRAISTTPRGREDLLALVRRTREERPIP